MTRSPDTTHLIVGAGPVGRHVAAELLGRGIGVRMVTRTRPERLDPRIDHRRVDATDADALTAAAEGCTAIHNAANPPYDRWPEMWPPIMAGVTAAARATGATVVQIDNLYMYGPGSGPMREDTPHGAIGSKGTFRSTMIRELLGADARGEIHAVVVRASDFYGPEVTQSGLGDRAFPRILAGKRPQLIGRPDARHSFSYVPDVARAMVDVSLDPGSWGQVWHAPAAPATALADVVTMVQQAAGVPAAKGQYVGKAMLTVAGLFAPLMREMKETLYQWTDDFVVVDERFVERFGWSATPMTDGIAATVQWYREVADRPEAVAAA